MEGDVAAGGGRSKQEGFRQRPRSQSDDETVLTGSNHNRFRSESGHSRDEVEGFLRSANAGGGGSWDEEDADEFGSDDLGNNATTGLSNRGGSETAEAHPAESGGRMQRWREDHPGITRIGTFFFFRSPNNTTTENAAYAPSGPMVFGAALDLSMPVLFNFHIFIEAYNHIESMGSETPVKILPIIFLSVLIVRTVIPPGRRGRFWGTVKFTFTAPLHPVNFRDDYIGDVLTSLARPSQDLFFAASYYLTVIWGSVTGKYGLTESGELLENSMLLHNVILPSCAILPLWWKYLQTLRQAHDTNKRWPYQGNSLKYLLSTLVIIYGMTHPEEFRSKWWLLSFFLTLVYQIWWDVMMDWELFEINRDFDGQMVGAEDSWFVNQISSFNPSSTVLLKLQMYILQPMLDLYQRIRASIPSWRQIQLRSRRLYKTEAFYWKIFAFNIVMRFTWMICFIPAYHFNTGGGEKVTTSSGDVNSYFGVLLPVAEIVRRTLWGFLSLERETLKMMDADAKYSQVQTLEDEEDDNSKAGERSFRTQLLPTWLDNQQQVAHDAATSSAKQRDHFMRQLFVVEIYVWAAAFVILGCWAAS